MSLTNSWTGIGHLGADAEVRYTKSGDAVASFNIACNERRKSGNHTEWMRVSLWGTKLVQSISQYLLKGTLVCVQGPIHQKEWEKDGQKRHYAQCDAREIEILKSPGEKKGGGGSGRREEPPPPDDDDSIPF